MQRRVASSLVSALLCVIACAGKQQGVTAAAGERSHAETCKAQVAVGNPNSYGVLIAILDRGRRVQLGPVEPYANRTFPFLCPRREFQFILDVGDPGVLPVDAATNRVPCWLTDKSTVSSGQVLTLTVPGGLEGRLGSSLCPRAR
ncbi:MAG: hypothetical protein OER90_08680 [Gemmatimonadota bacterium]|nr:hypothetical protein [Gemmatimonadota bacterium]